MSPIYVPGKVMLRKDYVEADPYFGSVSLLLYGDGTNGSTTIVDSSPTPKTVTAAGNAQISTAIADPFGSSTGVLSFDGSGDWLTAPKTLITDLGTGAFTLECWVYLNEAKEQPLFAYTWQFNNFFLVTLKSTGALDLWFGHNLGGAWGASSTTPLSTLNTWHHVAVCRSGNTFTGYVNGVAARSLSTSISLSNSTGSQLRIAGYYDGAFAANCYMSNIRLTKNVARYTSNFTPPTTPFPDIESR